MWIDRTTQIECLPSAHERNYKGMVSIVVNNICTFYN